MYSSDEIPENSLPGLIKSLKENETLISRFISELIVSTVFVPSVTEVDDDYEGLTPLFFEKSGVPMMVMFTSLELATRYSDKAPYSLSMKGGQVLKRLPSEYGIVINPECEAGLDISPEGIKNILRDFK